MKRQFGRRFRPGLLFFHRLKVERALILLILVASSALAQEIERIWVDGQVNDKPLRFAFDTGSYISVLTRQTALKIGLHLTPAETNVFVYVPGGKRYLDLTEECRFKLGPFAGPFAFAVLDIPAWGWSDFDGVLGWSTVTNAVVGIDALAGGVTFFQKVPPLVTEWPQIRTVTIYTGLGLEIPHGNLASGILAVDTGSDRGLALPRKAWRKWKKAHPRTPLALGTSYTPSDGFYIYEEAWADKISFGPITFNNVPIEEAGPSGEYFGTRYEGTVGLTGLKSMELVVDPSHAVAYWRQRKSTYSHYSYNHLGAVFTPTAKHPNEMVGLVMKDGPAYAARIRDGDVLLQVDQIKVTSWNNEWLSRFYLPPGTKLKLRLTRRGKAFETTATLSEILKPMSK